MDLSPADPNVLYFMAYPQWALVGGVLTYGYPGKDSGGQISRSAAEALVADAGTIPVVHATGIIPPDTVNYSFHDPDHFYEFMYGDPSQYMVQGYTPYAIGGGWAYPNIGGSSARLVEVATVGADAFLANGGDVVAYASDTDGEQYFYIVVDSGDVADHVLSFKVWDFNPTSGPPPEPPSNFWTGFIGSREIP